MNFKKAHKIKSHQKGAMILVFLMVFFIFSSTIFLSATNTKARELNEQSEIRYQLELAKSAILAYGFNYETFNMDNTGDSDFDDEGPGRLPCPDVDNDGLSDSSIVDCTDNVRGRLPEYITLPIGSRFTLNNEFADLDQQFWYVVSPGFKEITTDRVSNSDGELTLDGQSDYVAVIIAPGDALDTQDRASDSTDPSNYLESTNVSGEAFVSSNPANPDGFNDVVIGITYTELMTAMTLKVVQVIKVVLDLHHDTTYCCVYGNFPYYPDDDYYYNSQNSDWWEFSRMMRRSRDGFTYPSPWPVAYPDDLDWWRHDRWEDRVTYTRLTNDSASISFDTCAITFTLTHDAGITRDQQHC